MTSIRDLKRATSKFFDTLQPINFSRPIWSDVQPIVDGKWVNSIHQQDSPGCYALLRGDEVAFIGVGMRGSKAYPFHGIGYRIKAHRNAGKLRDKTGYLTLAFPVEHRYLSLALEAFLIEECSPADNLSGHKY